MAFVYILSNRTNTVLYVGVTNDLARRLVEHRQENPTSFTRRYNVTKLLYFEQHDSIVDAISREKQIKGGSRAKKVVLIARINPGWEDLSKRWNA